jgi:hypothetical protein
MSTTLTLTMRLWRPALALLLALTASAGARAQAPPGLAGVAKNLHAFLQGRGADAVAVGDFRGPPQVDSNYGPGIQQGLGAELAALKVRVDRKAKLSVTGEYLARVYDRSGEVLTTLQTDLKGTGDLARYLGATVSLPPNATRQDRNQELKERLDKPSVHIKGTLIYARPGSPYAVEVLVKKKPGDKAVPCQPRVEEGQVYVDLRRDDLYEIKVYNGGKHEAAVTCHIDGLDVFTFSELRDEKTGRPRYSYYVVKPQGATQIVGWHKRNEKPDNYLSFQVMAYGKGASAFAPEKAAGKTGVITCTYSLAWTGRPPDEEKNARDAGGNETGFGPPVSRQAREVERQVGVVRDVISIRYSR